MLSTVALASAILLATPADVQAAFLDISVEPIEGALELALDVLSSSPDSLPFETLAPSDFETPLTLDARPNFEPGHAVTLATAPEPTTALLLGLGLVGLAWTGRPRPKRI